MARGAATLLIRERSERIVANDQVGAVFDRLQYALRQYHNGPGWDENVAAIHRWIVQRLGAPLLALYEEADGD